MKKIHALIVISFFLSLVLIRFPESAIANDSRFIFDNRDVVFLGDSTTNAMRYYEVLPGGKNTLSVWSGVDGTLSMWDVSRKEIGITQAMYDSYLQSKSIEISNDIFRQTDNKKNHSIKFAARIGDLCRCVNPGCIVITLGINGCACMTEEDFKAEYSALIDMIHSASPQTRIILNSIYPVSRECRSLSNSDIDRANEWIADIASYHSIEFIDTNKNLKDNEGFAPSELVDTTDGIHWNRAGYARVIRQICSKITLE